MFTTNISDHIQQMDIWHRFKRKYSIIMSELFIISVIKNLTSATPFDCDKLLGQVIKRVSSSSVSDRNSIMRAIEIAQKSKIALYNMLIENWKEKKQYNVNYGEIGRRTFRSRQAQEDDEIEQEGSQREADQAMIFLEKEELTEDMKEKLIEKVIVYPRE